VAYCLIKKTEGFPILHVDMIRVERCGCWVDKCISLRGLRNFVACHISKRPFVMVVESYEWRKCLFTRQSQLTSGQMHFIKVCRVATICPLEQVVKSIFPLVSCRHAHNHWLLLWVICTLPAEPFFYSLNFGILYKRLCMNRVRSLLRMRDMLVGYAFTPKPTWL